MRISDWSSDLCASVLLLTRLETFRINATEWGRRSQAGPYGLSFLAADVAKLTLVVGQPVIAEVDSYAADLGATLASWLTTEPAIRERVDRLSWLLDGWEDRKSTRLNSSH